MRSDAPKDSYELFLFLFNMAKRTNKKLMGMDTAYTGIGAHLEPIPNARKAFNKAICNR
jgi:hypothetical protein